jgi:hypothetical protein
MDKLTFALGGMGIIAAIEGISIYCGRDGALLAALTGIMGAIAGSALGFQFGTKATEEVKQVVEELKGVKL